MLRKIIKFSAARCVPCKIIAPVLKELCQEKSIMLEEIDVEDHPDYAQEYNISKVPTVVLVKENWDTHTIIWAKQKDEYIKEIEFFVWWL